MVRRSLVLLLAVLCVAFQKDHDVKILHPKARLVLGGFKATALPFQAWVERNDAHRFVQLEVWDISGTPHTRVQSSGWSIDGDSPKFQPTARPLIVHLGPGVYTFRALACTSVTEESECGRVRASASQEVRVCGESC